MTQTSTIPNTFDPRNFRDVMGHYPTGVVVVTAMVDNEPIGMVVGTFSSVSIEPPLVSFMPMRTSGTYAKLRNAEALCISVFAHDQLQACRTLASKDPEKFEKVDWTPAENGAPKIAGAVAHIYGRIAQEVEAGDHYITLVSVDDLAVTRPTTPLLFFQGGYGGFSTTGLSAHVDESFISAMRVAESARPQLEELTARFGGNVAALVQISPIDQTIGASSYGENIEVEERIGVRIPLIPPLGEAAVAWDNEQIEQWVSRIWPKEDDVLQSYRDRAASIREQGYAISRYDASETSRAQYEKLGEALSEYGLGELTPARDRAVRGIISDSRDAFGGAIEDGETTINLASIVVPVFAPDTNEQSNSGLVLRMGNIPQGIDADAAFDRIRALQEAAAAVTETLRSSVNRDYARYVSQDLRRG